MALPLRCDWCLREEAPKVQLPSHIIIMPKGWILLPIDEKAKASEVIAACNMQCKKKLVEAQSAIKDAHDERRKNEEKKKRAL